MNHLINDLSAKMVVKGCKLKERIKEKFQDNSGNWLEESMKYIAAVVIGLIVMAAIAALFKDTALPSLKQKVLDAFNIT